MSLFICHSKFIESIDSLWDVVIDWVARRRRALLPSNVVLMTFSGRNGTVMDCIHLKTVCQSDE